MKRGLREEGIKKLTKVFDTKIKFEMANPETSAYSRTSLKLSVVKVIIFENSTD